MDASRSNSIAFVASAVALLLQLIVAPYIQVLNCMPNVIIAYVMVMSVVRPSVHRNVILAFVLGLSYNLLQGGPVGALALVLVGTAYLCGRLSSLLAGETRAMHLAIIALGICVTEFFYGLIVFMFGMNAGFIDVLTMRVFPCTLLDVLVSLVWYVILSRISGWRAAGSSRRSRLFR